MTLQEEFLRDFLARQRKIYQKSLEDTTMLSKANIEGIIWAGLRSPPTLDKVEETMNQLKALKDLQTNGDQL